MIKKTITFKDLDGNDLTDDFYFNLTESELVEMEITASQRGFSEYLTAITRTNNVGKIFSEFKNIILKSYGERSDDNKRFIKSPALSEAFTQTDAYNVMFMEMIEGENLLAEFINGLVPAALVDRVSRMTPEQKAGVEAIQAQNEVDLSKVDAEPWITENRDPTKEELRGMTPDQMRTAFARKLSS